MTRTFFVSQPNRSQQGLTWDLTGILGASKGVIGSLLTLKRGPKWVLVSTLRVIIGETDELI